MTYTRKPDANPHASALGSIKTAKKAAASKLNGLKGGGAGRPKKTPAPAPEAPEDDPLARTIARLRRIPNY